MKLKRTSFLAWALFGLITIVSLFGMTYAILAIDKTSQDVYTLAGGLLWLLLPVEFAFLGALILSRQPRNVIGWLLMLPAIALAPDSTFGTYYARFVAAPPDPSLAFALGFWFYSWSWLLLIYPVFFVLLLFPTGRPVSPRWRWSSFYVLAVGVVFFVLIAFQQSLIREELAWSLQNPVGFIPDAWAEQISLAPFLIGLLSTTAISVAAMIIRYMRAAAVEREQIKWLLFACIFFAVVYIFSLLLNFLDLGEWGEGIWWVLGSLALMTLPAAIAIAILRYRLWDIDVIIRRTLVYGALSVTLALVYFGSVILLQNLLTAVGGQQTAVVTVISTLLIAALFTPLRRRIQRDIDRRFFRKKYDAEKVVAAFGSGLRQEVDLEDLQVQIVAVVEETLQPEQVGLWLRTSLNKKTGTEL